IIALADRERVTQILENLVSNAVKYSPAGGAIKVSLSRQVDRVFVAISDSGLGIPRDELPKLFTRFHRVEGADRAPIRGTGLGLYITRELVDRHGGTIWAESQVGKGTTFTFTLPVVPVPGSSS